MLLRNKLSLITLGFFLVAAIGLSFALNYKSSLQAKEFGTNAALQQASLWGKIQEGQVNLLLDKRWEIRESADLLAAISAGDKDRQHDIFMMLFISLRERGFADRLEYYNRDGLLDFSSQETYFPTPTIRPAEIQRIANGLEENLQGLVIDAGRNTMTVLAIPIGKPDHYDGVVILSLNVARTLDEFKRLTYSEVFLVNRRGRLLFGTNMRLWDGASQLLDLDSDAPVQTLEVEEHHFVLTGSQANGALNQIGYIVSAKEVTESRIAFRQLEWITYGGTALFLLLAGFALWAYMRHSLHPLSDAIRALGSLSQGNFSQRIYVRPGRDEVSRIGIAITKFHEDLMRLERMTKLRHTRSQRQSNIIRRELTGLADTLDEQARADILNDLDEVESRLQETAGMDEGVRAGNELAAMALTLSRLKERIQDQHGQLAETISELEEALKSKTAYLALQQELEIGTRVQIGMLPDDLPQTPQLRIAGKMVPAKEVGGDFYDFFYLDENRLAVVVADVSGKGVPAALFMAITRSLLRATVEIFERPSDCIAALNDAVCDNNKEELFVTVFYGILDLRTGSFSYTNAGHDPAYLMPAGGGDGQALPMTGDVALGVMEDLPYEENTVQLQIGDGLFFYTDGVSEAMSETNEEYGNVRLEAVLRNDDTKDVSKLLDDLYNDIHKFAGAAPQFDDITCVMLRLDSKLKS